MARQATTRRQVHSERAQWAWTKVSDVWDTHQRTAVAKEYATHVRKLPARIQINGLGQALAFLFAKSKGGDRREEREEDLNAAGRLLVQLGERMGGIVGGQRSMQKRADIMKVLVTLSPDEYRRCTHELMTTAEWLKRFVDGLFEKDEQ